MYLLLEGFNLGLPRILLGYSFAILNRNFLSSSLNLIKALLADWIESDIALHYEVPRNNAVLRSHAIITIPLPSLIAEILLDEY